MSALRATFRALLFVVLTAIAGGLASAQQTTQDAKRDRETAPRLALLVYAYTPVREQILQGAKQEAIEILGEAGIELNWAECSGPSPSGPRAAACSEPCRPWEIVVRLLPGTGEQRKNFTGETLGYANLPPEGRGGNYATVFLNRLEALSQLSRAEESRLLGLAVAHEIGHLLLGSHDHSSAGIMKAAWTREDLRLPKQHLMFSQEEIQRMRGDLIRRSQAASAGQTSEP